MTRFLLRGVAWGEGRRADVRVAAGRIREIAPRLVRATGERALEADGGTLLPGLHDHHIHLLAAAAALGSIACGPPQVDDRGTLHRQLRAAATGTPPGRWLRGVRYHEDVAGGLDRHVLDRIVADRPVRIQHRSGAVWFVNSAGLSALGAETGERPTGVELDADGRPTGRLWRVDGWLRDRLGPAPPPNLAAVGRRLVEAGVTGVTDATPDLDATTTDLLVYAVGDGRLPLHLQLLGARPGAFPRPPTPGGRWVTEGPQKLVLSDHDLPSLPVLVDRIRAARQRATTADHPVAVHCVTRESLILLAMALHEVGPAPGDRIEHAAIVPDELVPTLARLGVTVVTQPGLLAERGDTYLRDVAPEDVPLLYRHGSLLRMGIPVALSTDAPYTELDPWSSLRAATERRTRGGTVIGTQEKVSFHQALGSLLTPLGSPGATPRRIEVGGPADLCLLASPLVRSGDLADVAIRATFVAGELVHDRS